MNYVGIIWLIYFSNLSFSPFLVGTLFTFHFQKKKVILQLIALQIQLLDL
jgi:hypothetical protein